WKANRCNNGAGLWLVHIHDDDEAEVVVNADGAVNGHEDGEPNQIRMDGRSEDIEFSEEARRDWKTEQRKQENAKSGGNPGLALAESGIIVNGKILFARAAELRNDGERSNLHERIAQKIKENGCVRRSGG